MPRHAVTFTGYADTSQLNYTQNASSCCSVHWVRWYFRNHTCQYVVQCKSQTPIRHESHRVPVVSFTGYGYTSQITHRMSFTRYWYMSQITRRVSLLQGTAIRHKSHTECLIYRVRLHVTNHTMNVSFTGYGYTSQITQWMSLSQGTATRQKSHNECLFHRVRL